MTNLTSFEYDLTRELNYSSEDYHNISSWHCFYDFSVTGNTVPFKYQVEDSSTKSIFNGTEKFELHKPTKTFQLQDNPGKQVFQNLSFLYNSLVTLKTALPLIIADNNCDKTIRDSIINGESFRVATINTHKRRIQNTGDGFEEMQTESDFIYSIIIDKKQYLPVEIIQTNNINKDFIKTSFNHLIFSPPTPSETSWYYSSYLNEYTLAANSASLQPLAVGSVAPNWKLETMNNHKMISLGTMKGRVLLIDFWIKNCSPCIQSVPHLNELKQKFERSKVEIVSINAYDSKEDIGKFMERHKIKYNTLLNGKAVATQYGVNGFPTIFIINKTGRIIYVQAGFNESTVKEIEAVIKNAL